MKERVPAAACRQVCVGGECLRRSWPEGLESSFSHSQDGHSLRACHGLGMLQACDFAASKTERVRTEGTVTQR